METLSPSLSKTLNFMIYGTLAVLAIGLVTSTTILSLSHILMILPGLYFLFKVKFKSFPISAWALLALSIVIILSIIFNQDIIANGYKALPKVKYFIFGFLMIAPFHYYFKKFYNPKNISYLLYLFCIATTVASIAGMIGVKTGYNYISMRVVNMDRNAGLSGMVLNYAHNLAFFQIIILGLIIYRENLKTLINKNFLYIVFAINLLGLYLSFTRGAILAFCVGAPFYLLKKSKKKFFITAALLIVFGLSIGKVIVRPGSDRERVSQWKAAWIAFKERPILGYGFLNFEQHSVEIKKKYDIGELQFGGHAHNNFLEILSTTGVLGFICFLVWLLAWLADVYRRNDIIADISLPFIVTFVVGGLTQSTIALGVNLFFIMAAYSIAQASRALELKSL